MKLSTRKLLALLTCCMALAFIPINAQTSLNFIKNVGQIKDQNGLTNDNVKFLGINPGMNVQLKNNGFSYDSYVKNYEEQTNENAIRVKKLVSRDNHRIDFEFLNGNESNVFVFENENAKDYFLFNGKNRVLMQYGKTVINKNVFNKIDVEYTFTEEGFKYNFILNPGANINDIKLKVNGANSVNLKNNTLSFETSNGTITEDIPVSFYKHNNRKVKVNYTLIDNVISFTANHSINKNKTFIIDPVAAFTRKWGTYYGGEQSEEQFSYSSDADELGNVYTGGETSSTTQIATAGAYQTTVNAFSGDNNAFIIKYDVDGNKVWGTYFSTQSGNNETDLKGLSYYDGNLYITGGTDNGLEIVGASPFMGTFPGATATFVLKMDTDGNPVWSTYNGGAGYDFGGGIRASADGLFVTTRIGSGSTTQSTDGTTHGGNSDCLLQKFNLDGAQQWATYFGGSGEEIINAIGIDTDANIFIAGHSASNNLTTTPGAYQAANAGSRDIIVAKYNQTGTLLASSFFGSAASERLINMSKVEFNSQNQPIITSHTTGQIPTTAGVMVENLTAVSNVQHPFVVLFSNDLTSVTASYFGTNFDENSACNAYAAFADSEDNIVAVGYGRITDGIATADAYQAVKGYEYDGYIVRLSPDLTSLLHGTYIGAGNSGGWEEIRTINNLEDNIFITGLIRSVGGIDPAPNNIVSAGASDAVQEGNESFAMFFCGSQVTIPEGDTVRVCAIADASISADASFASFDWTGPETSTAQQWSPTMEGQYIVEATDNYGCTSKDTIVIVNSEITDLAIQSSNGLNFCGTVATTLSTNNNYTSYVWSTTDVTPTTEASAAGTFNVVVQNEAGCTATADITLTAGSFTIDLGADQTVEAGTTVNFSGPAGLTTYTWTPAASFDCSTCENVVYTANVTNTVILAGIDASGCTGSDTVIVNVNTPTPVDPIEPTVNPIIPQGFSPNGDGTNDTFKIGGVDGVTISVKVWNRWGGIVFETKDFNNTVGWDGTCQGNGCLGGGFVPEGTYFYNIKIQDVEYSKSITIKK